MTQAVAPQATRNSDGSWTITSPFSGRSWNLRDIAGFNSLGLDPSSFETWHAYIINQQVADFTGPNSTITGVGAALLMSSTPVADGSQIQGTTTFTRTNGTTGPAATVAFAADANGYTVQPTTVTNADGSTTITLSATRSIVASSSANMRRSAANVVELQASV